MWPNSNGLSIGICNLWSDDQPFSIIPLIIAYSHCDVLILLVDVIQVQFSLLWQILR